jgi:Tripartite tricarboxylate transporter family receptor
MVKAKKFATAMTSARQRGAARLADAFSSTSVLSVTTSRLSRWNRRCRHQRGIFLPKGTPAPIVRKLHDAVVATINNAPFRARLIGIGVAVVAPERRSAEYLKGSWQEVENWSGVV